MRVALVVKLAFEEARAALKEQDATLGNLRNRATGLLAAVSVGTSFAASVGFLNTDPTKGAVFPQRAGWTLLPLTLLIGGGVMTILWPAKESAVIVPVPEAEAAVGEHRSRLDRAASWGVPAHVTVLFPFLPPDQLGSAHLRTLADAIRSVPRFDTTFADIRWFGEDVVWVAPEPDLGFHALIDAVTTAFPEYPPYGGAFGDSVPHLTIGAHAGRDELGAAAEAVAAHLPFAASIDVAHLLQGSDAPGAWHRVVELPLG